MGQGTSAPCCALARLAPCLRWARARSGRSPRLSWRRLPRCAVRADAGSNAHLRRQGVKLLFEDHTTGVMLLQAPGSLPSSFKVYMAGINAEPRAVPTAAACIQHPGGGGKRMSVASGACAPRRSCTQAACPARLRLLA